MIVHRSNRTERLLDALVEVVGPPGADPFAPETIAVQGPGMERWLSFELARRLGCWANPSFPFPRRLIEQAVGSLRGDAERGNEVGAAFEPEELTWSIAGLLPGLCRRDAFAEVARYLEGDRDAARRVSLAQRIAETLDHYVVYRPEMILGWERGEGDHWQAILWRSLVERLGPDHLAGRAHAFFQALGAGAVPRGLPGRISLFGLSTLPPLFLEVLMALEDHVEIHLFLLTPTSEYWADIRPEREIERWLASGQTQRAEHVEGGHPLLASLGRVGREFQGILEGAGDYVPDDRFEEPAADCALAVLQGDILDLRERAPEDLVPLADDDRSLSIHSCHGPMRELQVLYDQLLAIFAANPSIEPRHVVVMTPAIHEYAPYIDAAFGSDRLEDGRPRVPYSIADREARSAFELIDGFARVLDTLSGRLTASEVIDLLGCIPVRRRFAIELDDLDWIRGAVRESGVRWAVDGQERARAGQPADDEHTWRFGLDRLLLGYALRDDRTSFGGVLPYAGVEGGESQVLGRFVELCEVVFRYREQVRRPHPIGDWSALLQRLLDDLLEVEGDAALEQRRLQRALDALRERAARADFREPVDLATVRAQIDLELHRSLAGHGFLSGGVTFCELIPMRTVPFRVVCLLGMNDGAFPRIERAPGFDWMARRPRAGDRSPREDGRYVFLEALLSARDHLLITYAGQDVRDNSPLPPSVVVGELLATVDRTFVRPGDEPASRSIVVAHPLQPFSPRCFGWDAADPRLQSYSPSQFRGARALLAPATAPAPFLSAPLPPGGEVDDATVELFRSFFQNPARAFLQQRLDLNLGADLDLLEDRQPIELSHLDRWALGSALLAGVVEGQPAGAVRERLRGAGRLPPGTLGLCEVEDLEPTVEGLAALVRSTDAFSSRRTVEVDLSIDGMRIRGRIGDVGPHGIARFAYSRLGRGSELQIWIEHLLLQLAFPRMLRSSVLLGRDDDAFGGIRLPPVANALALLQRLVRLFRVGHRAPLPLFRYASRAYAEQIHARDDEAGLKTARTKAQTAFAPARGVYGDMNDPYVAHLFTDVDPIDPGYRVDLEDDGIVLSFDRLARDVVLPLVALQVPFEGS